MSEHSPSMDDPKASLLRDISPDNYGAAPVAEGSSSSDKKPKEPTNSNSLRHTTYGLRGKRIQYFAPAYLVMVIKKVRAIDFGAGTVTVSLTLVLHVLAQGLPSDVRAEVMDDKFELRLNDTTSIKLSGEDAERKRDEARGTLTFTRREEVEVAFKPTLHGFPFDFQYIHLKFEMTSRTYEGSGATVRYNLHLYNDIYDMVRYKSGKMSYDLNLDDKTVSYAIKSLIREHMETNQGAHMDDPDGLPEMNIAFAKLEQYRPTTPPEVKEGGETEIKGEKPGKIVYFPALWVTIPIYREPNYILLSSVFPLLILNIFSLCIFFVDPTDYTSRLSIVITVLLALFAFLPTYRSQAPLADTTSLDLCVFGSIIIMVFVMLDSQIASLDSLSEDASYAVRWLFSGLSIAIVVAGCLYFAGSYIKYQRTKKQSRDAVEKMGEKRSSSGGFPDKGWELKGITLDQIESQVVWLKRGDKIERGQQIEDSSYNRLEEQRSKKEKKREEEFRRMWDFLNAQKL